MEFRLTFRNTCSDVCWQKQLRDKYSHIESPVIDANLKNAIVRRISRKIATQIILKYEWLGTIPIGCNLFYGMFFGLYCCGVTCICIGGGGANVYAYKEFGLNNQKELAYLARGANVHWSPHGANSKLVSLTCRLLAKETSAQIIIAYSDTDAGEIGTIYQASNWNYIGVGSHTNQWISPNGRILDQKLASNIAKKEKVKRSTVVNKLKMSGFREQKTNPKHRYVYILNRKNKMLVDLIEKMSKEYPKRKRAASIVGSTSTDQVEGGGSIPTAALHESVNVP